MKSHTVKCESFEYAGKEFPNFNLTIFHDKMTVRLERDILASGTQTNWPMHVTVEKHDMPIPSEIVINYCPFCGRDLTHFHK